MIGCARECGVETTTPHSVLVVTGLESVRRAETAGNAREAFRDLATSQGDGDNGDDGNEHHEECVLNHRGAPVVLHRPEPFGDLGVESKHLDLLNTKLASDKVLVVRFQSMGRLTYSAVGREPLLVAREAESNRLDGGLGAVADRELLKDRCEMVLDRLRGNVQPICEVLRG